MSNSAIDFDTKVEAHLVAEFDESRDFVETEGEEFLAANKKKEGVKTLPSGLQYQVLREGKGKHPKATDEVKVHYKGTFIDGTVFDRSPEGADPVSVPLAKVKIIPGWIEALQLMQEGAKWRIFIPSDLAYGRGGKRQIGPNQTLIFEIELVKVN